MTEGNESRFWPDQWKGVITNQVGRGRPAGKGQELRSGHAEFETPTKPPSGDKGVAADT